jgi:hypothetical protein
MQVPTADQQAGDAMLDEVRSLVACKLICQSPILDLSIQLITMESTALLDRGEVHDYFDIARRIHKNLLHV